MEEKKNNKTLLIVLGVLVLLGLGLGVYFLMNKDNNVEEVKSEMPSSSEKEEKPSSVESARLSKEVLWDKLFGYWTIDNTDFVVFYRNEDKLAFNTGIWNAGGGRAGAEETDVVYLGDNKYKISVFFPAQEENMMEEAIESMNASFEIDLTAIDDGKIAITFEDEPQGTGNIYLFSGRTSEEALESLE